MRIPSPREIGLPAKYETWRPVQEEAIRLMLASQKRNKVVNLPVGSGKTIVVIAYAVIIKEPLCVVTENRGLQDQYMEDGKGCGMVDIRGRNNYPCHMRDDYTCEEGHAANCPHKGSVMCGYSAAEIRASISSLVVTNYSKWISSKKFGKGMEHFKAVVFEEGHASVDAVAQAMQVMLHHREIEETLGVNFLSGSESGDMDAWKKWASETRAVAELKMLQARSRIAGITNPKPAHVRHYTHMRLLLKRLTILMLARPRDWVVEEVKDTRKDKGEDQTTSDWVGTRGGFQFDPVRVGRYTESALFFRVPNITFISATIRPKTMFLLGQPKASFDFWEFDSEFDPKRCPIYYIPTMRVDHRAGNLARLWLLHDQIAAKRTDRKGLVQTISFTRRDEVLNASRFAPHMLINPRGEAPTEILEQFYGSGPGSILVSPSFGSGYDFAMTRAEWQFICKIPFPPPSKILKARTDDDKEYPYYVAWNKLAQIFGRIMRDKKDRGESFIGDAHLDWFLKYSYLAPKSFKMFLKRVDYVPPPPPRL